MYTGNILIRLNVLLIFVHVCSITIPFLSVTNLDENRNSSLLNHSTVLTAGINKTTVTPDMNNSSHFNNQHGKVYVILSSALEGMSKWIYIVTDLLGAVREYNDHSVFVEPCIKNGRITPCNINGTLPMSVVFDFETGSQALYHNQSYKWMSWKNFTKEINDKVFDNNNHESAFCQLNGDYDFQRKVYITGRYFRKIHRHIKIDHYVDCVAHAARLSAKDGKNRWIHIVGASVSQTSKIPSVNKRASLPIKKIYYDQVKTFTNATNYIVLNWRSETINLNVIKEYIPIVAKIGTEWKKNQNSSIFLVSDISFNPGLYLWYNNTGALSERSIEILKSVYLKLETLPGCLALVESQPVYKDLFFLSLWDLILSEQADLFIACTDYRKCRQFNRWNSGFTNEIFRLRQYKHKNCVTPWSSKEIRRCNGQALANYM